MSFEVRIVGHSPGEHAHDVKEFAIAATRTLKEQLGEGSVSLSGYATDSKHSFTFGDVEVAEAETRVQRKKAEEAVPAEPVEEVDVTDAAAKLAKKNKIDLATVEGTGAEGRVTVGDVEAAIKARESA